MTAVDELATTVAACRVCGCTDDHACSGGCWWVPDPEGGHLCSTCRYRMDPRLAYVSTCVDCGLSDRIYVGIGGGRGDGVGSCGCPAACQRCGVRPGEDCLCEDDEAYDDGGDD